MVTRAVTKSPGSTDRMGKAGALGWDFIGERRVLAKSLACDVLVAEVIPAFSLDRTNLLARGDCCTKLLFRPFPSPEGRKACGGVAGCLL
jgi:hypothetical protein